MWWRAQDNFIVKSSSLSVVVLRIGTKHKKYKIQYFKVVIHEDLTILVRVFGF